MATKIVREYDWKVRPLNRQSISVWSTVSKRWEGVTYYADGIDGILEWNDEDECELYEYKNIFPKWRGSA